VDVGQHLVAAFHAVVAGADYVHMNTALPTEQGDIDVIALYLREKRAVLCEVKTHLRGLNGYDGDAPGKIRDQMKRARSYAKRHLSAQGWACEFELWSPKVGPTLADKLAAVAKRGSFELVINDEYAARVRLLVDKARDNDRYVDNPAFRTLQVLTRLPGVLKV
jgi:Holliday junction resolvase-like predicted endonuclease